MDNEATVRPDPLIRPSTNSGMSPTSRRPYILSHSIGDHRLARKSPASASAPATPKEPQPKLVNEDISANQNVDPLTGLPVLVRPPDVYKGQPFELRFQPDNKDRPSSPQRQPLFTNYKRSTEELSSRSKLLERKVHTHLMIVSGASLAQTSAPATADPLGVLLTPLIDDSKTIFHSKQ